MSAAGGTIGLPVGGALTSWLSWRWVLFINVPVGAAIVLLVPAVLLGMYFFIAQFLQIVLGYSAIETGLAFLPMAVLIFAGSQAVPRFLPRFGPAPS